MSLGHGLYAFLVLALAYFIRGISGFGSGLVAVPLLAIVFPLSLVVPTMLLLDFTASLVLGGLNLKHVRWSELKPLFPFGLAGVALGTIMLVNLPRTPLLMGLGVFLLVFAIRSLLNLHGDKPVSSWWAIPASFAGGTIGALFGTGGPPYVVYLSHRLREKDQLRATLSGLFFFEGLMRIISFTLAGLLLNIPVWRGYGFGLPVALLALYGGSHVHTGLSRSQVMRMIGVLLLLSSLSLFVKACA
ncbi:MAG: sulfite exporter TauE/SafE family protein [Thiobacillaceae bacterium]